MRIHITLLATLLLLAHGGEKVPNFTLEDTNGRKHTLYDQKDAKAIVLFFIGTECPLANRYLTRLNDLATAYSEKNVVVFAVNASAMESVDEIAKHATSQGIAVPVLLDRDQKVADSVKVGMTPTAVLIDAGWEVRYRGAFDDNKSQDLVKRRWLREAIDAVLGGKEITVKETETPGCTIQRPLKETGGEITFAEHIAPLYNKYCVSCHRPGQVAPFSLTNYETARRWARDCKLRTQAKQMPPWKPVNHGVFRDERLMTDAEIARVAKWADNGAPLGDEKKLPEAPKFAAGWMLGEPDAVFKAPEFELGPTGADEYRCYVLPTAFDEDKWVSAVEVKPGNFRVVHHIIVYLDTSGKADKLDAADPGPGYKTYGSSPGFIPVGDMGGWAPGDMPYALPEGVGRLLKKGGRIVMEVHYHRNGRTEKDTSTIGLHFSRKPIVKQFRTMDILNFEFNIKAGDKRHHVEARARIGENIHVSSIMPHMHLTGREAKVTATLPDKTEVILVHIKDWDFNWQDTYHFKESVALPKGTKVLLEMWYDNSAENPNNPNSPPKDLTWGEQTTDEMCLVFLFFTRDGEDKTKK